MPTKFRKSILAVSFALVALLASAIPVAAQSSYYHVTMLNNTGYNIYQLRLSSVYDRSWEKDLLGTRIFAYGTTFTVTDIPPGQYDLAVVDPDSDVCVVHNVAIYSNLNWNLSYNWLLNCER